MSTSTSKPSHHRVDRSEWRGQDDDVQRHHGIAGDLERKGHPRRQGALEAPAASTGAARIARTFQRLEVFGSLSARENILTAAEIRKSWARDKSDPRAVTEEILDRIGIRGVADDRVDAMPTGQARLVELGRALATKPRVLLLDEPASGQDEQETDAFADLLLELASEGMAILMVEHDVALVMKVCEWIHVLDFGAILAVAHPPRSSRTKRCSTPTSAPRPRRRLSSTRRWRRTRMSYD